MLPPDYLKRLRQVEVRARIVSEQLMGGRLPSHQRPPHPGPLPPFGRAEREKVSTSANSTHVELWFSSAFFQTAPNCPRQHDLWRRRANAGVPLSPGKRARVRAGQDQTPRFRSLAYALAQSGHAAPWTAGTCPRFAFAVTHEPRAGGQSPRSQSAVLPAQSRTLARSSPTPHMRVLRGRFTPRSHASR